MATEQVTPSTAQATTQRYYKVQMRAWTAFDPSTMDLSDIAAHVDRGDGFLTAIEVVKVADNVNAVDDVEVREHFETVLAVEKVVENIADLPQSLRERLNAALSASGTNKNSAQGAQDFNRTQAA